VWRQPDHGDVLAARDSAEEAVAEEAGRAVRRFLRDVTAAATAALDTPSMVAAGTPVEPVTLGTFQRFWNTIVGRSTLTVRIRDAWLAGYRMHSDRVQITSISADALPVYMEATTDRLVRGLTPPITEDAFDHVRVIITRSAALGWDRKTTAQRLAADLGWEQNGRYWRSELTRTNALIDAILDPLGQPGHTAREHARLHDPRVRALQTDRSTIVKHLDAEASHWETRANLIARTETTSAYGYGSLYGLTDEGVECKEWLATLDGRTRQEHAAAHAQTRLVGTQFNIGGYLADCPGDPNLPVRLTARCRCCLVGGDCTGLTGARSTPMVVTPV
jgi:hypothetical protein